MINLFLILTSLVYINHKKGIPPLLKFYDNITFQLQMASKNQALCGKNAIPTLNAVYR